jgi:hypothetical protein
VLSARIITGGFPTALFRRRPGGTSGAAEAGSLPAAVPPLRGRGEQFAFQVFPFIRELSGGDGKMHRLEIPADFFRGEAVVPPFRLPVHFREVTIDRPERIAGVQKTTELRMFPVADGLPFDDMPGSSPSAEGEQALVSDIADEATGDMISLLK